MTDRLSPRVAACFQAFFVTFLWSTSFVLVKVGLEEIPAISFAGLRYFMAFLVLTPAVLVRSELRKELRALAPFDWARLSALGVVFYFLTQGAQFLALAYLPAVTVSLILSFSPVVIALLGALFLGERLSGRQWFGAGVFIFGAAIYFFPARIPPHVIGLGVAGFQLLAFSCGSLLGRAVNRRARLHPLTVTVVSMGVGALLLSVTGLIVDGVPRLDSTGWGIVTFLAVVNTAVAFTIWNHTLRRLSAIESTLINNTMLVQIALLAWLFLGEPIGARQVVGLFIAVVGAVVVQVVNA